MFENSVIWGLALAFRARSTRPCDIKPHMEDYFAYGILPDLDYLALLAAAVSIYLEKDFGLDALAGALLLLAIVNIRNAWDLTLTMVRRHPRDD
jgi:hypothetical protein